MKRFAALAVVGFVLSTLTGCGGADSLVKELIANINRWAEVVEKKESVERQQAAADRVRNTLEKIDRLKLTPEEKDKLFEKHEKELNEAGERLDKAMAARAAEGGEVAFPNFSGWKTPNGLMKDLIANLKTWAEVVEKKESVENQQAAADRVRHTVEQLDKLKMSPEAREKLFEANKTELDELTVRVEKGAKALDGEGKPVVAPTFSWKKKK